MTARKPWSRTKLMLAMNLYCKLPFGQLDHRTPEIIALAQALERSPSSVSMKLCNLASLDPVQQARGIKSLSAVSRADRAIWAEFHDDWESLGAESEQEFQNTVKSVIAPDPESRRRKQEVPIKRPSSPFDRATEGERTARVRYAQTFFRQTVLASYGIRCCITENQLQNCSSPGAPVRIPVKTVAALEPADAGLGIITESGEVIGALTLFDLKVCRQQ